MRSVASTSCIRTSRPRGSCSQDTHRSPVVTTLHRRLDINGVADYIDAFPMIPLIAISDSQRRWNPDANWVATVHHAPRLLDDADIHPLG
jgi:hypothetical protein